jgi:hypothetical protein
MSNKQRNDQLPVEVTNWLSKLTIEQLTLLNHRIVDRIKLLRNSRTMESMLNFTVGEKVCFDYNGLVKTGTIIRLNRKTVSLVTEDNERWNVAPGMLDKVVE